MMIRNSSLKKVGDHPELKIVSPTAFTLYLRGEFTKLMKIFGRERLQYAGLNQVQWAYKVGPDLPKEQQTSPPDTTSTLVIPPILKIIFEKRYGYGYDLMIARISEDSLAPGVYEVVIEEDWSRDIENATKYQETLELIFPEADITVDYKSNDVEIKTETGSMSLIDQGYDGTEIVLRDNEGELLRWWGGLMPL